MAMFNLFGKKKEQPAPQTAEEKSAPYKAFAAEFLPEEHDILAVTAPGGFGSSQDEASGLFKAGILLTAWLDEDAPDQLHREAAALTILADQDLLAVLRQRLPGNFILKFKARLTEDGKRMMLTNLPAPGFDPDLKAILEEQKKPVTFETEDLGEFVLSRTMNWFQTDVDWLDQTVQVAFDQEEDREGSLQTIRALLADPAGWNGQVLAFAAAPLLDRANEAAGEDEEPLTREQLMEYLYLETILAGADGRFEFWFGDSGLFMGSPVRVTGTLESGPAQVLVEG